MKEVIKATINVAALADILAYDMMQDEMFRCEYITEESEVYQSENVFTPEAQKIYDRWYEYFVNMIIGNTI